MFGIGSGELVIIAIVMLLAVGPKKMPTLIKAVGKGVREFRKASTELRKQSGIDDLLRDDDLVGLRKLQQDVMKEPPPVLSTDDRERERPNEGVDLADARHRHALEAARALERAQSAEVADENDEAPQPIARQAGVDDEESPKP
jgi:sec-independent protein translocase protein TatB